MTGNPEPTGSRAITSPVSTAAAPHDRRKAFIKSYGCQMNVYDARRMADALAPAGYDETDSPTEADVVVLNTCHIRERATEKVFSELGQFRVVKDARAARGAATQIVVAGCVAQAEGAEVLRREKAVDVVVGPQAYHRLPALLREARERPGRLDDEFPADDKFANLPTPAPETIRRRGVSAFVTVQEGCDKFCSFCVVPYTRGAEVSRPADEVIAEIATLARAGVREVTLLGQNVNAWRADGLRFADLLARAAAVPGIARVRYMTSHPNDMDDALVAAHRDLPALMPFLHLPVQSGSDRVLDAMNRAHGVAAYRAIVARVRGARSDVALSSDFIVGFPGETEEDFSATLALAEEIGFASAYAFKYSARPGTPAAARDGQVDEATKSMRLHRLNALLDATRFAFNRSFVGEALETLFERPGRLAGQLVGRTPHNLAVHVDAPAGLRPGDLRTVEILSAPGNTLSGRVVA